MPKGEILEIERLRGIGVLFVWLCHVPYFYPYLGDAQDYGGDGAMYMFFTMSGVVVTMSFLKILPNFPANFGFKQRLKLAWPALKVFYFKRVCRIVPIGLVWSAIPLYFTFVFNASGEFGAPDLQRVLKEFITIWTFTYNYVSIFDLPNPQLLYYHTYSVEEHFYILLPLFLILVPLARGRARALLALTLIICFVTRPFWIMGEGEKQIADWMRHASHNRFDALATGVLITIMLPRWYGPLTRFFDRHRLLAGWLAVWLVAMLAFVPSHWERTTQLPVSMTLATLMSFVLIGIATLDRNYMFSNRYVARTLEYFGHRGFPYYLCHLPSYWIQQEILFRLGWKLSDSSNVFLHILMTMAIVEVSHRWVEKPLIAFGRRVTKPWIEEMASRQAA